MCDSNVITAQDLSDMFTGPITGKKSVPGDEETCTFKTAGYTSVQVTSRPSLGHASVQEWVDGTVSLPASPLSGVGDRAMWQADMHEVIAEKNNALCDIRVMGSSDLKDPSPATMQKKIGALCNKIFAAR
jgi:hypothetical protein